MKRPDWQVSLKVHIRDNMRRPFEYGKLDGPMFAADALKAMTGKDVARGMRGYKTLAGGFKKLRAKGFETPDGPFAAILEAIPPMTAQPGDIVVFEGQMGVCLGVCGDGEVYAVDADRGLGRAALTDAVRAYRVPD